MSTAEESPTTSHLLSELGFTVRRVDDHLEGDGSITPEMHVPGTGQLRVSVITIWADMIVGLTVADFMSPRGAGHPRTGRAAVPPSSLWTGPSM